MVGYCHVGANQACCFAFGELPGDVLAAPESALCGWTGATLLSLSHSPESVFVSAPEAGQPPPPQEGGPRRPAATACRRAGARRARRCRSGPGPPAPGHAAACAPGVAWRPPLRQLRAPAVGRLRCCAASTVSRARGRPVRQARSM